MMLVDENHFDSYPNLSLPLSSSSLQGVDYSCGSCGHELNLNSCNRNASIIGSKNYRKSIKRGIITFFFIDETRFTRIEQIRCKPYFISARSWGFFRRRTKLLCRKCGNHVGDGYKFGIPAVSDSLKRKESQVPAGLNSWGWDGISGGESYDIRIRALQPSSYDDE